MLLKEKAKIHFVGIGGIGMSGIAEVLLNLGYSVSGSDLNEGKNVQKLKSLGAEINIGHKAENITDQTVVVYSSAINFENPEILATYAKKIPLIRRAEMLSELMRDKFGIAVAGSHGKTTTTSMLATILHESDMDPTHIIGGIVSNLSGHAKVGKSKYLLAEADESDGSFLLLNPILCTITNIDNDHLDYYKNKKNLENAFLKFANNIPFYGCCTFNAHDPVLKNLKSEIKRPWKTFAIFDEAEPADYEARSISFEVGGSSFELYYEGKKVSDIKINLPGEHNILNALGAISLAHGLGLEFDKISKGISFFSGVDRRFQTLFNKKNLVVVDDYGHHPTEIHNTIATALKTKGNKKLHVIFEPHRYSRTSLCWSEFVNCFSGVDELMLMPIYAASEQPIEGVSSKKLSEEIKIVNSCSLGLINSSHEFKVYIEKLLDKDAIVLTLGAGTIGRDIREIVSKLQ